MFHSGCSLSHSRFCCYVLSISAVVSLASCNSPPNTVATDAEIEISVAGPSDGRAYLDAMLQDQQILDELSASYAQVLAAASEELQPTAWTPDRIGNGLKLSGSGDSWRLRSNIQPPELGLSVLFSWVELANKQQLSQASEAQALRHQVQRHEAEHQELSNQIALMRELSSDFTRDRSAIPGDWHRLLSQVARAAAEHRFNQGIAESAIEEFEQAGSGPNDEELLIELRDTLIRQIQESPERLVALSENVPSGSSVDIPVSEVQRLRARLKALQQGNYGEGHPLVRSVAERLELLTASTPPQTAASELPVQNHTDLTRITEFLTQLADLESQSEQKESEQFAQVLRNLEMLNAELQGHLEGLNHELESLPVSLPSPLITVSNVPSIAQ